MHNRDERRLGVPADDPGAFPPAKAIEGVSGTRTFETGAKRNAEAGKLDYEGFLSPYVLERFAQYLNKHRKMEDGSLRDSDNWQLGIPRPVYMKSLWRHFHEMWKQHREGAKWGEIFEDAICGVMFNAMGYLHETLKEKRAAKEPLD